MAMKPKGQDSSLIDIAPINMQSLTFFIIGHTPLILNEQAEKAQRQLLLPEPKKNRADREQTLKHNPLEEFRDSAYRTEDPTCPTLLVLPANSPKKAIATAALDLPGATKAEIGRLVSIPDVEIPVWGIPMMRADMVRQAGMNKTPDVRFRCCLPEWAAIINFRYLATKVTPQSISNLLAGAGQITGIGDWRSEKGSGDYGQFNLVPEDDPEFLRIVETGGRAAQEAALTSDTPPFLNEKTRKLVTWFDAELARRSRVPTVASTVGSRKKTPVADLVAAAAKNGKRGRGRGANGGAAQ